jgi:D-alanyl-D-alanine carboxypeptidase
MGEHSMRMQESNMKFRIMTLALAATAFSSLSAYAQTTVIEERRPGVVVEERRAPVVIEQRQTPVVVEPAPSTSVTTHERGGFLGTESRTTTTTTGTGPTGDCATRTVHREDLLGEKTVSRTDCP